MILTEWKRVTAVAGLPQKGTFSPRAIWKKIAARQRFIMHRVNAAIRRADGILPTTDPHKECVVRNTVQPATA